MHYFAARGLLGLVALTLVALAAMASAAAPPPQGQVLRHIVMYKFRDNLPPAQVDQVVAAFSALPEKIDSILEFERGTNVSAEGKSQGMTHVFVVTFRDQAALEVYLKHPAHLDYVKIVQDKRDKVIVFDYWTAE
jgi:hypothetical protein